MRYLCITCEALPRPVYYCAATSPHIVDVELLKRGLHNQPANLRTRLQEKIDLADEQGFDGKSIRLRFMWTGYCGIGCPIDPFGNSSCTRLYHAIFRKPGTLSGSIRELSWHILVFTRLYRTR